MSRRCQDVFGCLMYSAGGIYGTWEPGGGDVGRILYPTLLGPAALCLFDNEMCNNEMSFSMMPQLSIMKTRFAKASLRPRCARHRSWGATCRLPNRRAGALTFPMVTWVVELSQ